MTNICLIKWCSHRTKPWFVAYHQLYLLRKRILICHQQNGRYLLLDSMRQCGWTTGGSILSSHPLISSNKLDRFDRCCILKQYRWLAEDKTYIFPLILTCLYSDVSLRHCYMWTWWHILWIGLSVIATNYMQGITINVEYVLLIRHILGTMLRFIADCVLLRCSLPSVDYSVPPKQGYIAEITT